MQLPAPVPLLPPELVEGARLLPSRDAILPLLPQGGTIAEVGVALGGFSRMLIDGCRPAQFIAIDTFRLNELPMFWGRPPAEYFGDKPHLAWYQDTFASEIGAGIMQVLEGDSAEQMECLPDASVDIFYLDADHSYASVKRDLNVVIRKIKPHGWLVINDYILIDQLGAEAPYGVIYATNEFMLEHRWAMQYFALQTNMFCDVALRRCELVATRSMASEVENAKLRAEVLALRSEIDRLRISTSSRIVCPIRPVGQLRNQSMPLFPITSLGEVAYQHETVGVAEVVVVVPLYNYKDYITEALQSIVDQDLQPLSVIVIDDCSIDEGGNIAAKFLCQHATRFTAARVVRHKRNQGLAMTRNSGIAWTTEPFLFMLDADNRIRPSALSRLLQALDNSGAAFAYSQLIRFGDKDDIGSADVWEPARLLRDNYIDAMALIRRDALQEAGGYRASAVDQGWEDWDLWCHCASLGLEGVFVPELLCEYRVHRTSMLRGVEGRDLRSTFAGVKAELALRYPDLFNPKPNWISVHEVEIQCLKAPASDDEVALVATYSPDGVLQAHVRHYVESLKRQNITVILILSSDGSFATLDTNFTNSLDGLFLRRAEGRDFAAWAQILHIYPELYDSEILYLINDSVVGPTNDAAFAALLHRIRQSGADLIGLTESFHQTWHFQSYFLAVKSNALSSSAFREFMGEVVAYQGPGDLVRDQVIKQYELRLAQRMKDAGLFCEALFPAQDCYTPTANHWKRLLSSGFPFVKIEVISGAVPDLDASDWRELIASQGYDPSIAARTLEARRRGGIP